MTQYSVLSTHYFSVISSNSASVIGRRRAAISWAMRFNIAAGTCCLVGATALLPFAVFPAIGCYLHSVAHTTNGVRIPRADSVREQ